ncbi:Ribosome assembly protein 4 {ECO:0000250/UniProtKB:P25382} AltName: Full=Notchless protein homolog 1 {ECO:0000250/UniProtKB:Q9VPR4}; AltName: Full=Ribosome biogenesis factor rsa4 {ECO:0000250/UniProtKB:Q9VPR4}, partial [Serendipita indica DSM 11827]
MSSGTSNQPSNATQNSPGTSSAPRRGQVNDTAIVALEFVANIAEASDKLSAVKAICRATKTVLEAVQAVDNNDQEWVDLMQRLKVYESAFKEKSDVLQQCPSDVVDDEFRRLLDHYAKVLQKLHTTVNNLREERKGRLKFWKRIAQVKKDAGDIGKLNRDIEDGHRQLMEAVNLFIAHRVQAIEQKVKTLLTDSDANALFQLPMVASVASSVHSTCLEGTRTAVLQMIRRWADDNTSGKPIFWLCDIAGSGKSTVAMSAVESWREMGVLGGRFFFSIASSEGSTIDKFCSTIARELAHNMPELASHIAAAVKQNPAIMRSPFEEQFRRLILGPLNNRQERAILVVDAIDECKSQSHRRELLDALAMAANESANLKLLITSRPDSVVEHVLGSLSIKAKLEDRLHSVNHQDNIDDIARYMHQSLSKVLPEYKVQQLVEKANGLFIWATTVCRLFDAKSRFKTPERIYDHLISMHQTGMIDDLYSLVFERMEPPAHEIVCEMLALLLAAFEPLTVNDLDDLMKHSGVEGSALDLVTNLGSVLTQDASTNLIQFRHPTLVEYLQRRCTINLTINDHDKIYIDLNKAHSRLASWCLQCLKKGLRFNICQLESSFYLNRQVPDLDVKISHFIPQSLRYASVYWTFHVTGTDENCRRTLKDRVWYILQTPYVLYWMEILSFIRGVPRVIAGFRALSRHVELGSKIRSSTIEVRRFMMTFSVPIQESAAHIYISALPFTPRGSMLHSEGLRWFPNVLKVSQGLEDMYPNLPRAIRGHSGAVNAVAVSPDGSIIASCSSDATIRLWDTDTGQPLGVPLRGHQEWVKCIAFSPDGSIIASGSSDMTIRLWDADTGQPLGVPLQGHRGRVKTVTFSPEGSRIASGSSNGTILLWDANTRQPITAALRGSSSSVNTIAFSPDGSRIISGSSDRCIRQWDSYNGQCLGKPLRGHNKEVKAVAFSPDGSRIASGSSDHTIRLWNAYTGEKLWGRSLVHDSVVTAVGFSPDGLRVVSCSRDKTVRVWNVEGDLFVDESLRGCKEAAITDTISPNRSRTASSSEGSKKGQLGNIKTGHKFSMKLRGHTSPVNTVAFIQDGSRIISGSSDKTIRQWDPHTGEPVGHPTEGHEAPINAVAFSPDGQRIASGSRDWTLRMWNADNGRPLGGPLRGHDGHVNAVAFSPDGLRVISCSSDKKIRWWNAETGEALGEPLRGHKGPINSISLSRDGLRIVSGSSDKTIRVWDAHTGQQVGEPFQGHQKEVMAVAFSPDGSRIVSGSADTTIILWDANTGVRIGEPIRGHSGSVVAVLFSPDGSRILSGSRDKTMRLWHAVTGQSLGHPFRGHQDWIKSIAFSPDGSRIVSGSRDWSIMLWDAATVSFSPDGSRIVSASSDTTIRVWNAEPDQPLAEPLQGDQYPRQAAVALPLDGFEEQNSNSNG